MVSAAFLQGASALVFSVYGGVHLANTAMATYGPETFNEFQLAAREIYLHPAAEAVTIGSVIVHMVAGMYRSSTAKPKKAGDAPETMMKSIHRNAGYLVALIFCFHLFGTMTAPHRLDFEALSFLIKDSQTTSMFYYFYFAIFAACGVIHFALGMPTALRLVGLSTFAKVMRIPALLFLLVGLVGTQMGLLTMKGVMGNIPSYVGHPSAEGLPQ